MKLYAGVLLAAVIATAALTRYYWPRIVTQTVEVEKEVLKTDIRTITKIVERPDGTKETVVDTTDRSTKQTDSSKQVTVAGDSEWLGSVGVTTELQKLQPTYTISVSKRVMGPFFLGLQADTSTKVGVLLTVEF